MHKLLITNMPPTHPTTNFPHRTLQDTRPLLDLHILPVVAVARRWSTHPPLSPSSFIFPFSEVG